MPNPETNESFSTRRKNFVRRFLSPTGLAIFLHLVLVLPLAAHLNIWLDEGFTMETTARGVFAAWREGIFVEHQAPLYFVAMALWRGFHDSLFFVRLFSIICTVSAIGLVPALIKRFTTAAENSDSKVLRNWLPLVAALHPYTIWASVEARVYAPIILLSAALLLFWYDGFAATEIRRETRRAQIFYFLLAVTALYTNYYLGFLLFANACALLALKRWKACLNYVLQMAAAGLLFAPLVLIIKRQFSVNADYYREPTPLIEGVKLVWNIFNYFLLPSAESDSIASLRVWAARLAALALVFLFFRNFRRIQPLTFSLAIVVGISSSFLMAAFFLMGVEYTQHRHAAPLFLPVLLCFAAALVDIAGRRGVYLWLGLLLIFAPTRLFYDNSALTKNGDWQRVSKFIEANEAENEPIATFQLHDAIPLGYVYRGKNPILRAPRMDDWAAEDRELSPRRWQKQIEILIAQIPPNQSRFWIVADSSCFDEKTRIECEPLENFLRENFTVEKSEDFYKRRVRLLRRR